MHSQNNSRPAFMQVQQCFTQHIRDPQHHAAPEDIEDSRMAVYRDLFYNNIENFIATGFPVIRSIYSDEHWHAMVRDFMIMHRCHTPYFLQIAEEFLDYLENERQLQAEDPAGLYELAHYEWAELALTICDEEPANENINPDGDLLSEHPVLSPLAWLLEYQFPVHRMSSDYLPDKAPEQPTFLIMYRNLDDAIQFMEINIVTAHLLHQLEQNPVMTGRDVLRQVAQQLHAEDEASIVQAGLNSLEGLHERGIIIGTLPVL